jgi:bifunctional UDP-N-acetylglucosamine pyrophosphorylase/glucosamine-1-phosphate N-acetyltransferase
MVDQGVPVLDKTSPFPYSAISKRRGGGYVEPNPRADHKINQLIQKGAEILNPLTLDIGDDVEVARISGRGVKIYPGCRIYGQKTVISEGAQIGFEGPVTIENCQIGPGVELKGGFFRESVFLERSSMGLAAQVREGCLLEEQASGAHCVGLKQTILFPFVTLGSLVNFCDCLMSGGTGRRDHSEVGSSYIHFNFTPDGDKTTPSLIGDVPRGVMLTQRPIFLGGQGGMVGPLRLGFGNVIAAGTILRRDYLEENKLIMDKSYRGAVTSYIPNQYSGLSRLVRNNVIYLANLVALDVWYRKVRQPFFEEQELGTFIYEGALEKLTLARRARIKRLTTMADRMPASAQRDEGRGLKAEGKREFRRKVDDLSALFTRDLSTPDAEEYGRPFLTAFHDLRRSRGATYLETIKGLPEPLSEKGTKWLQGIVDGLCHEAANMLPAMKLFKKYG